jgi:hypothetical protein
MSNETPTINKGGRPRKPGGKSVNLVVNMSPDRKRDVEEAARNLGISASEYIRLKVFDDVQTRFEERNRTGTGNQFSGSTFPESWDEFYRVTTARFLELSARAWREKDDLRKRQAEQLLQFAATEMKEDDAELMVLRFQVDMQILEAQHLDQFYQVSRTAREHSSHLQTETETWKKVKEELKDYL